MGPPSAGPCRGTGRGRPLGIRLPDRPEPGGPHRGAGLRAGPEWPAPGTPAWRPEEIPGDRLDLAAMLRDVDAVLNHETLPADQRRFLIRGSSVGGAQPKAAVEYEGRPWIAKFPRELEQWPTSRIELAAMRLAAKCGIRVPECRVVDVGGRDVFLTARFDRDGNPPMRHHFLSAMTLTGADDMTDGTYGDITLALRRFGVADQLKADLEEMFRRMVFNIRCNNRDDHFKNHGFLYDCLLYTSDAADEEDSVNVGGRRTSDRKNVRSR
eukprot:TRINITY_DN8792_c0_g1_i1.p2 TRINITY_DN8792_c0_g1~~TRINITY_DN8792_c0_g1_i1.p2  ORF type:complete len:268 (-),score=93.04 TRINITY_DN8792_c0_g1_i1:52-855(-)